VIGNQPLDIVYLFRHSKHGDTEILYSLRSVAQHLPFIRKVWIFGDEPEWLSDDTAIVENVGHGYVAPLLGYRLPVRNDFLMLFLSSLIPGLTFDFVRFSDDYIVLQPLKQDQLCTVRALADLNKGSNRGEGKWRAMLWTTYDILKRYGYAGYNFEAHVPQPLNKQLVFEAFMAFRQFLSEDRYQGMHSPTAVYNYALKHHGLKFKWLAEEQSKAGFYGECPPESEIAEVCRGKLFLSFDDPAFGQPMQQFLHCKFPEPCKYERG
jgi:hypothetical protein